MVASLAQPMRRASKDPRSDARCVLMVHRRLGSTQSPSRERLIVIEAKPGADHPANHGSFSRHFDSSNWLAGDRVRQQGKFLAFQLTPAATVPVGVPNQ